MAIDYAALKTELLTATYATPRNAGSDQGCADLINAPSASIPIRRGDVASDDISNAIVVADYTVLPGTPSVAQLSTERRLLAWITGVMAVGTVRLLNTDGTDAPAITNFKAMFAAGTGTLTRLTALASRNGSRAEQLFGVNTFITAADVAKALR